MSAAILQTFWHQQNQTQLDIDAIVRCYSEWEAEAERLRVLARGTGEGLADARAFCAETLCEGR